MLARLREQFSEDEIVSGEDILSGARDVRVYVPDAWTVEYVGFRLKEAYETLRRANVGKIFPGQRSGFWPEILHDWEDIRGWADQHRKDVEASMARRQARPTSMEIDRMDEALTWPMRRLADQSLLADAVTLWAFTAAYDIDPRQILRERKVKALAIAEKHAARENTIIGKVREGIIADSIRWAESQFQKRGVGAKQGQARIDAIEAIRAQARIRADRALARHPYVKANATLGMPGKVLAPGTLDRLKTDGLNLLADRLNAARVPVR